MLKAYSVIDKKDKKKALKVAQKLGGDVDIIGEVFKEEQKEKELV